MKPARWGRLNPKAAEDLRVESALGQDDGIEIAMAGVGNQVVGDAARVDIGLEPPSFDEVGEVERDLKVCWHRFQYCAKAVPRIVIIPHRQ